MTDQTQQNNGAEASAEVKATETPVVPASEAAAQEKPPEVLAREAELRDISDMFKDFSAPEQKPEEKASENDSEKTPKTEAPADEKKEEKPTSPAPSPADEKKPEAEAKTQNAELANLLKDVLKEAKGEETPKKEEPKPEPLRYNPQVPDTIMAALEHEDPAIRKQGMNAMIGGAMNQVFKDVMKEVEAKVTQAISSVPQIVEQNTQSREALAKTRKEFYDENPEFASKGPKFQQLVAMAGLQLAQELQAQGKYTGFTPEFQKALAKHIEELTGVKAGKTAPKPKVTEVKEVKASNGFQAGGAAARTGTEGTQSLADEIADTIMH